MFYLVKVLIGRAVASLDRPFSYYSKDDSIRKGMRVLVSFGPSKSTIAFVIEDPLYIEEDLSSYQERLGMKLSPILTKVDEEPLLNEALFDLAKHVSKYYKADMIRVLQTMLPPSLKPKDSALKKAQGKTVDFLFANPFDIHQLSAQEQKLYQKIK